MAHYQNYPQERFPLRVNWLAWSARFKSVGDTRRILTSDGVYANYLVLQPDGGYGVRTRIGVSLERTLLYLKLRGFPYDSGIV